MATFNLQSVKALFKNKYALAGVAVAAGAGGYVLWKKSRAGGQGDAASTATGVTGVSAGGTADTTGNDVATWLGSYSVGLQNMLQDQFKAYGQTLSDALKGINPTTPANGDGWKKPGDPGYQPKPTGSVKHVVQKDETSWTTILNRYFWNGGNKTTNEAALMGWSKLHGGTDVLKPGAVIALPTSSPGIWP